MYNFDLTELENTKKKKRTQTHEFNKIGFSVVDVLSCISNLECI